MPGRALILLAMALCLAAAPAAAEERPDWWGQAQARAQADGYRLITAPELDRMLQAKDDLVLLDVRPDYEYRRGHIPGAENLEFHLGDRLQLSQDKARALERLVGPDRNRLLVVYCRSFKCLRSEIAARWAVRQGYRKVARFIAGWHGWLAHTGRGQAPAVKGLTQGDFFPTCRLVVLGGKSDRRYLGLPPDARAFALSEVGADFLFVELYHQLCYGCLEAVESYNRLFQALKEDPFLQGRVKMLGLGVGSLHRQVHAFRRREGVRFPLFADQGREIFRCLGQPELPVAYVLHKERRDRLRIVRIIPGGIKDVGRVLQRIKAAVAGAAP
jgi:rhodanese-related sulfurtransferase